MKRFFRIAARTLILIAIAAILLPALAQVLLNSRVLPSLIAGGGLEGLRIHISQLTPWALSGQVAMEEAAGEQNISAHFRLGYSPLGLLRGRIDTVTIDGAAVRVLEENGHLRLPGLPPAESRQGTEKPALRSIPVLPVMVESLTLRDCQFLLERGDNIPSPGLLLQGEIRPQFATHTTGGFRLRSLQANLRSEGILPASLSARADFADDTAKLHISGGIKEASGFSQITPLPDGLRINGSAQFQADLLLAAADYALRSINARLSFPGLTISGNGFSLASSADAPLEFTADGNGDKINFRLAQIRLAQPLAALTGLEGAFQPATGELTGTGSLGSDRLALPIPILIKGSLRPESQTLEVALSGDSQRLKTDGRTMEIGRYRLSARLKQEHDNLQVGGELQVDSAALPGQSLRFEKISSRMAFTLSSAEKEARPLGTFTVAAIRYRGNDLAGLDGTVALNREGLQFSGEVAGHRERGLKATFTGTSTSAVPAFLAFTLPAATVTEKSLSAVASLPAGMKVSGRIRGSGTLSYDHGTLHGHAGLSLEKGRIDLEQKKIHLDGISASLALPLLPQLSSSPSQRLKITSLSLGNLAFTDGTIVFRIEDSQTLFIESSRFTWCGGRVETGSLRVSLTKPELSTTLYCDRLQFAQLLAQLGISEAEGDGSLNGRLPLHFTGKEILFDDGFLFSTPGNSGIVRFNNTNMLRQGLQEAGQAAYLDYSMQAMTNFSYNWTKLTFTSKGEDLLVTLQIDGKPATPLPFGYRNGLLVAETGGQGIQHPILLDVNFHLPFAQMFKYGQSLQKMMEKTK